MRVTLFRDHPAEGWPSMDRYAAAVGGAMVAAAPGGRTSHADAARAAMAGHLCECSTGWHATRSGRAASAVM